MVELMSSSITKPTSLAAIEPHPCSNNAHEPMKPPELPQQQSRSCASFKLRQNIKEDACPDADSESALAWKKQLSPFSETLVQCLDLIHDGEVALA